MNVIIKVATRTQRFSVGTADGDFTFSLDSGNGFHVEQTSADTEATFRDVPAGEYTATVEKLGVSASTPVTVVDDEPPAEGPDIEVPASVTATVEMSTAAQARSSAKSRK